jgi:hypothetical protein
MRARQGPPQAFPRPAAAAPARPGPVQRLVRRAAQACCVPQHLVGAGRVLLTFRQGSGPGGGVGIVLAVRPCQDAGAWRAQRPEWPGDTAMIGFRLTTLEAHGIASLYAALPPDADEIAELEAFLPALAARGYTRALLDLSQSPPMDAGEAFALRAAARRIARHGVRLALVGATANGGRPPSVGVPVHATLSAALALSA